VEGLEERRLFSGAAALVAERRQIIVADLRRIHLDFVEISLTGTADLRQSRVVTATDRSRIGVDAARLRSDEASNPSQVTVDLQQLELDQSALRADIILSRQKAIADRNALLNQLNQDRLTLWGDYYTHLVQPPPAPSS
jgi:hypothetical protein